MQHILRHTSWSGDARRAPKKEKGRGKGKKARNTIFADGVPKEMEKEARLESTVRATFEHVVLSTTTTTTTTTSVRRIE
eukprot:12653656-Prorocentrum_lima.AAC.1